MKARVVALRTGEHVQVELLLPWYVNGTLAAGERARVEAHLARCTRCRSDLAFQTRLRQVGGAPGVADETALGWEALRARMNAEPVDEPTGRSLRRGIGWPLAWAIQCAASVSLALVLLAVALHREPYRTLGASGSVATANALVVFLPGATEAQVRAALRASGARLVGGPTVTDAYLLEVPEPGGATLDRLRAQPGVAQAESLAAGSAP